jgi:hypothetical protein
MNPICGLSLEGTLFSHQSKECHKFSLRYFYLEKKMRKKNRNKRKEK